jgi:hypothetical protein
MFNFEALNRALNERVAPLSGTLLFSMQLHMTKKNEGLSAGYKVNRLKILQSHTMFPWSKITLENLYGENTAASGYGERIEVFLFS